MAFLKINILIGVCVYTIFPDSLYLSTPLVVAGSILAMQYLKCLHPLGGATALITVSESASIKSLGHFTYYFLYLAGL
ncbi:MAG: HPP family protein [Paludibacteraceae bacterium]|nr:HPP family protein [Paludibacteraceae bacterium]MBN2787693.1 HPP family protein [Paludibacteraceae bacterium]